MSVRSANGERLAPRAVSTPTQVWSQRGYREENQLSADYVMPLKFDELLAVDYCANKQHEDGVDPRRFLHEGFEPRRPQGGTTLDSQADRKGDH